MLARPDQAEATHRQRTESPSMRCDAPAANCSKSENARHPYRAAQSRDQGSRATLTQIESVVIVVVVVVAVVLAAADVVVLLDMEVTGGDEDRSDTSDQAEMLGVCLSHLPLFSLALMLEAVPDDGG